MTTDHPPPGRDLDARVAEAAGLAVVWLRTATYQRVPYLERDLKIVRDTHGTERPWAWASGYTEADDGTLERAYWRGRLVPPYSTDLATALTLLGAAWEIQRRASGYRVAIGQWVCEADTLAHAIALAYIASKETTNEL